MSWSRAKASTWYKVYADEVGGDAYKMQDAFLYECVGAAYVAFSQGVGYDTEEEFRSFVKNHMKLGDDFIEDAIADIKSTSY